MKKNETTQNYLEAIYIISLSKDPVRAIDVAEYLHFSRPTVSVALKELENNGYLLIDNNSIKLTENGREVAKTMQERHEYIAKILMHFGVSEQTAYQDSCMVEHDLSEESFAAIKRATENIIK